MFSFNTDKKEIRIYDVIGESWDGTGVHAGAVAEALDAMGGQRVTVRINSPGGIADEGVAIYNTLKRYPGGVDTVVDALAASAASIVALAGENRVTLKGSRWMIHRAMGIGIGNANDMRRLASVLEVYDGSLAEIYAEYMDLETPEILTLMDDETWYDAQKSLESGLSTALVEEKTDEKAQMAAWFARPPEDLATQKTEARLRPAPVARELARIKMRMAQLRG